MSEIAISAGLSTSTRAAPAEQRLHPRSPLYLDALLSGGLLDARACKIRDCCPDGLFLSVDPEEGELTYTSERPIARGDQVEVHFFAPLDGHSRGFSLRASVARVLSNGIGVALVGPDPLALRALSEMARRSPRAELGERPRTAPGAVPSPLLETCAQRLDKRLGLAWAQFLRQAQDLLNAAMLEAANDTDQRRLFDLLTQVKTRSDALLAEVRSAAASRIAQLLPGAPAPRQAPRGALAGDGLALVEKEEFEEFLAVAELIDRLEPAFIGPLRDLEDRLSSLFGRPVDRAGNPFAPGALCGAFSNCLTGLTRDAACARMLYRAVEAALRPMLQGLYPELAAEFERAGVKPRSGPSAATRPRPEPARRAPPEAPAAPASPAASPRALSQAERAARAVPLLPHRAAHTLFALRREVAPTAAQTGPTHEVERVVEALGSLGADAAAAPTQLLPFEDLRKRLEQRLAEEVQGLRLEPAQLETLELVSDLFDAVLADPMVVDAVKPVLARLHLPLQQAALRQPDMLDVADHPVRRMLDGVTSLRGLEADPDSGVGSQLKALVERVVREAALRPDVFADAAREVERLVEEQAAVYDENLARLAAAADEHQRLLNARRRPEEPVRDPTARMPEAMRPYLTRARSVRVGDEVEITQGQQQRRARVGWVAEDQQTFVLADTLGRRLTTVGLQEFAMQLRRGSAKLLERRSTPVVERALLGSLQKLQQRVEQDASLDEATGLLTARAFEERIEQAVRRAGEGVVHALALVGIDGFERLESAAPPDALAALLREAAERLAPEEDAEAPTLARLPDGVFGLLFEQVSQGSAFVRVDALRRALAKGPLTLDGVPTTCTVSAGLTRITAQVAEAACAQATVRAALEAARAAGGNCTRIHETVRLPSGQQVDAWLSAALDRGGLGLAAVPLKPLTAEAAPHVELLPRLLTSEAEGVPAAELRQAAERLGRGVELDRWVLREGVRAAAQVPEGWLLIRLASATLEDPTLLDLITELLLSSPLPPGRLCFELTDSRELGVRPELDALVRQLKEFGCRLAIGDFGAPHVSFANLRELGPDLARIHRMDRRDILHDRNDALVLRSVVEMGQFIGLPLLADEVGSEAEVDGLRELGVAYAEGPAVGVAEPLPLARD